MQELALLMVTDWDAQSPSCALVRQAKADDAAAFEAILSSLRRVLLTAMRLLNGNLEDAKDAAQQVFCLHRSCISWMQTGTSRAGCSHNGECLPRHGCAPAAQWFRSKRPDTVPPLAKPRTPCGATSRFA